MFQFIRKCFACAKHLPAAHFLIGVCLVTTGSLLAEEPSKDNFPPPADGPKSTPGAEAPAAPPPEAESPVAPAAEGANCPNPGQSFWENVPPIRPVPRAGNFIIPPTGPGYYSVRDWLEGNYRQNPPVFPYGPFCIFAGSFFDANFNYLDKPNNQQFDPADVLKRIHFGSNGDWMFTTGGEFRWRFENEPDSRLSGKNNNYDLTRLRIYGDLWYQDFFRLYVEGIDARTANQNLPPLPIDINRTELLNCFIDLKLAEIQGQNVYLRTGRQELLYGSQRLISPLDWANTRRTFQGVKAFTTGEKWNVDLFWVQPLIVSPSHFDSVDDRQNFSAFWTTYKPKPGTTVDFYYLNLDNANHIAAGKGGKLGAFNTSTFGARCAGDYNNNLLWDFEAMIQFGPFSNQKTSAGAYSAALGYQFKDLPTNPQFWICNDWAAGDHHPGTTGIHGTFNQLFPFGHYYLGFLDLVGRQNIDDLNMQFFFFPTKCIGAGLQYHIFRLDSAKDALYAASGAPLRRDVTGKAGTDVGDEIDFFMNFHVSTHQDVLIGFSKLFAGSFIRHTPPSPGSPELFYVQYAFRW